MSANNAVQITCSTPQSLTSGTNTVVVMDTTNYNPASMTINLSAGYIQLNTSGRWLLTAQTQFCMSPTTSTVQRLFISKTTGTPNPGSDYIVCAFEREFKSAVCLAYSFTQQFSSGDRVYMHVICTGTSPSVGIQTSGYPYQQSTLSVQYMG